MSESEMTFTKASRVLVTLAASVAKIFDYKFTDHEKINLHNAIVSDDIKKIEDSELAKYFDASVIHLIGIAFKEGIARADYRVHPLYKPVPDTENALRFFNLATESSRYASSMTQAAEIYLENFNGKKTSEAIALLKEAAAENDAQAKYKLAVLYMQGEDIEQNPRLARKLLREAVAQEYAPAQTLLGGMYYVGEGVKKNYKIAAEHFRKAALQGDAIAQSELGYMLHIGKGGVAKDSEEGLHWLEKASDQGEAKAKNTLGVIYQTGDGVPPDEIRALKLFEDAAQDERNGHPTETALSAMCNIAILYKNGVIIKQDDKKAEDWIARAVRRGFLRAQFLQGIWSANTWRSQHKARHKLETAKKNLGAAAAKNHVEAQYELGRLQREQRKYQEAFASLKAAANKKHSTALDELTFLARDIHKQVQILDQKLGHIYKPVSEATAARRRTTNALKAVVSAAVAGGALKVQRDEYNQLADNIRAYLIDKKYKPDQHEPEI